VLEYRNSLGKHTTAPFATALTDGRLRDCDATEGIRNLRSIAVPALWSDD
jgi:hypothetical protein